MFSWRNKKNINIFWAEKEVPYLELCLLIQSYKIVSSWSCQLSFVFCSNGPGERKAVPYELLQLQLNNFAIP